MGASCIGPHARQRWASRAKDFDQVRLWPKPGHSSVRVWKSCGGVVAWTALGKGVGLGGRTKARNPPTPPCLVCRVGCQQMHMQEFTTINDGLNEMRCTYHLTGLYTVRYVA